MDKVLSLLAGGDGKGDLLSRKWLCLLASGVLCYLGTLTSDQFMYIALAYLGAQGVQDGLAAMGKKQEVKP